MSFDLFAWKKTKKQRDRERMARIRSQGRDAEDAFGARSEVLGTKAARTSKGSDYRVTDTDMLTGRRTSTLVEVKSGRSRLSKLQKKTQRKHKGHYEVVRDEPILGF